MLAAAFNNLPEEIHLQTACITGKARCHIPSVSQVWSGVSVFVFHTQRLILHCPTSTRNDGHCMKEILLYEILNYSIVMMIFIILTFWKFICQHLAQEKKNVNSHQFVNFKSIVTFMRLLFLKYLLIKIENYYKINYLKVET